MTETAMYDSNDTAVFVAPDGAYSETFPRANIVRRGKSNTTVFDVYGFVGSHSDYTELRWSFSSEQEAIEHATNVYGSHVDTITHQGEIFDVEVHERDLA